MGKKNLFKFLKIAAYICGFPLMSLLIFLSFKPMVNAEYMDAYITGWVWATLGIWAVFELIRYAINHFTANKKASTQRVANIAIVAVSVLAILLPVSIYGVVQKGNYEEVQAQAEKEGVELKDYNKLLGWANAYTKDQDVDSEVKQLNNKIVDFMNTYNVDDYNTESVNNAKNGIGVYAGVQETLKKEIEKKEKLQAEYADIIKYYTLNTNIAALETKLPALTNELEKAKKDYDVTQAIFDDLDAAKENLDILNKKLAADPENVDLKEQVNEAVKVVEEKQNKADRFLALYKVRKAKYLDLKSKHEKTSVKLASYKKELQLMLDAGITFDDSLFESSKVTFKALDLLEKVYSITDVEQLANGADSKHLLSLIKYVADMFLPDSPAVEDILAEENLDIVIDGIMKMLPELEIGDALFKSGKIDRDGAIGVGSFVSYVTAFYEISKPTTSSNLAALLVSIKTSADELLPMIEKMKIELPDIDIPVGNSPYENMVSDLEAGKSITELKTLQAEIDNYGEVMAYANVRHIAYIFSGIVGIMTLLSMVFASKEKALKKEEQKA